MNEFCLFSIAGCIKFVGTLKLWLQSNKNSGHIMSVFHSLSSVERPLKQCLMSRGTPTIVHIYRTENKEKVAHGSYSSTVDRRTPAIFEVKVKVSLYRPGQAQRVPRS